MTAIEAAVADGRADAAVHSAKDMTSTMAPGLVLAAVPPRAEARTGWWAAPLAGLPPGAWSPPGSARRRGATGVRPSGSELHRDTAATSHRRVTGGEDGSVAAVVGAQLLGHGAPGLDAPPQPTCSDPLDLLPQAGQGARSRCSAGPMTRQRRRFSSRHRSPHLPSHRPSRAFGVGRPWAAVARFCRGVGKAGPAPSDHAALQVHGAGGEWRRPGGHQDDPLRGPIRRRSVPRGQARAPRRWRRFRARRVRRRRTVRAGTRRYDGLPRRRRSRRPGTPDPPGHGAVGGRRTWSSSTASSTPPYCRSPPGAAELIDVGKTPGGAGGGQASQDEMDQLLGPPRAAQTADGGPVEGRRSVSLRRGGEEEADVLTRAKGCSGRWSPASLRPSPYRLSSAFPVTHRGVSLIGDGRHRPGGRPRSQRRAVGGAGRRSRGTLVILMGMMDRAVIADALQHGGEAGCTPTAVIGARHHSGPGGHPDHPRPGWPPWPARIAHTVIVVGAGGRTSEPTQACADRPGGRSPRPA